MSVSELLSAHPSASNADSRAQLVEALDACVRACTICADACLSEEEPAKLAQCIRSDLDCADICYATAAIVSRQSGSNPDVAMRAIEACELACRLCAEECEKHAEMHEHCKLCAKTCRDCEELCGKVKSAFG